MGVNYAKGRSFKSQVKEQHAKLLVVLFSMEALLGLNGVGGIGGECCCQCEHCKCRQPGETPCPSCRPILTPSVAASTTASQTSRPPDLTGAVDLLNVALKKIRRRGSISDSRRDNFFHPGEVLWGNGMPAGRMGVHGHGYMGDNRSSLF